MEILEFGKFCNEKVEVLHKQLSDVRQQKRNLVDVDKVVLPTGEDLVRLQMMYRTNCHQSLKNRLFGISKIDLKRYLLKVKRDELTLLEEKICYEIGQLQDALNVEQEEDLKKIQGSNTVVIKTIMDFSMQSKKKQKETLDFLLMLFRNTQENKNDIVASLEKDITKYFLSDGTVLEEDVKTIVFIFQKLLGIVVDDRKKYQLAVDALLDEIRMRGSLKQLSDDEKESLISQRQTIAKLQEYIRGDKVIKVYSNILEFEKMLDGALIPEEAKKSYLEQMHKMMKEEEDKANYALVSKYLVSEELNLYNEAKKIMQRANIEEQNELLERLMKDIVSICKYLDIGLPAEEVGSTREVLYTKIHLLREQLKMLAKPVNETSAFKYVTGSDGVPIIIRNLECMDTYAYRSVYNALVTLADNEEDKVAFTVQDIDFYLASAYDTDIVYTKVNDSRVLVLATSKKDINQIIQELSSSIISTIVKMQEEKASVEDNIVQQNYENLLIKLLDLDNVQNNKTLKKKEK